MNRIKIHHMGVRNSQESSFLKNFTSSFQVILSNYPFRLFSTNLMFNLGCFGAIKIDSKLKEISYQTLFRILPKNIHYSLQRIKK